MQLKLCLDTNHLSKIPKLLSFFADLIKCLAMMPETVLSGLAFPEGPRWHDGALYFSDMHAGIVWRSEEHTSELQSHSDLVCRLLLEKKKTIYTRALISFRIFSP